MIFFQKKLNFEKKKFLNIYENRQRIRHPDVIPIAESVIPIATFVVIFTTTKVAMGFTDSAMGITSGWRIGNGNYVIVVVLNKFAIT